VKVVNMGVPVPGSATGGEAVRARHAVGERAVLFVAFGEVTPEKRISQVIRGLAGVVQADVDAHLLLAGRAVAHFDPRAEAVSHGLAERVTIAGFVPDEDVADYLAAADVCCCLRWPSTRETSASWLHCLAAARPTIVTDLAHMVDVPSLDPRTWTPRYVPADGTPAQAPATPLEPACVGVDILDEEHSLGLAMRRLATDARLRASLGRAGRRLWEDRFTLHRMVADYLDAIDEARGAPLPGAEARGGFPEHFLSDGTEQASALVRAMGVDESRIREIWR
jgi:glycosyltransferase involved in cell wall biosynthesis